MFKISGLRFFGSQNAVPKWRLELVSVMAKLGANYNSYYSRTYGFVELYLKKLVRLEVSTQFFQARVRFKKPVMSVTVWQVDLNLLKTLEFESIQYFKSQVVAGKGDDFVSIYIPEVLTGVFEDLQKKLKSALSLPENKGRIKFSESVGRLTSSGRSFWLDSGIGIKVDTIDMEGVSGFLNTRRLSSKDLKAAIVSWEHLQRTDFLNFFTENSGLYIQSSSTAYRYVVLERSLNFEKLMINEGDFLIPIQALVSVDFWSNAETLEAFHLERYSCAQFFEQHLVREFARLIKNSVEATFLHFEIHQQNLTCHIRRGELIKLLVHDLQDVVFDPISYLLSTPYDSWPEALGFISQFCKAKFFNAYGEPRVGGPKHKFYFTPGSFYRRYFRNLGNYSRIYNHVAGEDYLFSRRFESLIAKELNYSDEDLGLDAAIKESPNFDFLREHLFWIIERRVETKQKHMLKTQERGFEKLVDTPLTDKEIAEVINRMKSEVCVLSCELLIRHEHLQFLHEWINKIYLVPTGSSGQNLRSRSAGLVYSIHLNDGERALLLFPR